MKKIFVTAAPIGAVPKKIYSCDSMFISHEDIFELESKQKIYNIKKALLADGWRSVGFGGMQLDHIFGSASSVMVPAGLLNELPVTVARKLLLILTTQGWRVESNGDLSWPLSTGLSYLPPDMVAGLSNCALLDFLEDKGWKITGGGLWQAGKACSTDLPITPDCIITEAIQCYEEGAAVVHLHTRRVCTELFLRYGEGQQIRVQSQANEIDVLQYEVIVPAIFQFYENAIINISTSVRGSAADFVSPIRRGPLKAFGSFGRFPDIASFSPGAVSFSSGGGYENPHDFLVAQIAHFLKHGIRPEIEVFNRSILKNALGPYRGAIKSCGRPALFMLVACVDQIFKLDGKSSKDDSLVPPHIKMHALHNLSLDSEVGYCEAVSCIVKALMPVVLEIRNSFEDSLISILLPGVLQALLVDVALGLNLDGIRVGLEDSLTITDCRVPGSIRKALGTSEQVSWVVSELRNRGITVMSASDLARLLHQ